ncbi:DEAD/DEAH box helicase [Lichenihabitans psoromatis]|uniref:DEAD/DEAH box helicase n=1 Tax=Lichenihabitans psoromatis TaxID=2528642 RepID=UPI0013F153BC|nr:DEAD/DEAH box helicase [Lichenihabitans psoromatis]
MSNRPVAFLAIELLDFMTREKPKGLIVAVDDDHRGEALARILGQLAPDLTCHCFPAWDCLPYDRAPPSPDHMSRRMRVLHDLGATPQDLGTTILVTTPDALVQRVPPGDAVAHQIVLRTGTLLDVEAFAAKVGRLGYVHADRVDASGHVAIRGEVIDIFTAASKPFRIKLIDAAITSIHRYDPVSQRSTGSVVKIRVGAASELVQTPDGTEVERFPGVEHWLPLAYPTMTTLLDMMPDASLMLEPKADERIEHLFEQIAEAYRDRVAADAATPNLSHKALPTHRLFLTPDEWSERVVPRLAAFPERQPTAVMARFCLDDKPGQAFAAYLEDARRAGLRIVLGAARERDLATLAKEAERASGRKAVRLDAWSERTEAKAESILLMRLSADHGFEDRGGGVALVTAADLLGHQARASSFHAVPIPWHMGDGEFAFGDFVIHADHGIGILRGLETIETGAAAGRDAVRLDYAKGTDLLAPVEEMDRIWRYGAEQDGITLDRLDTDAWQKRRAKISHDVTETARGLVALARRRDETVAPKLVPPRGDYERFVAGFPYGPTPDQIHAIDDVLRDLASGRPMDRLVVGDVGFGKTEVALRAAAAAVFAGRQVALVAPTTVLVRQHLHTVEQRFAAFGIPVAHLSRMVSAAEALAVKQGLADGSVRLVVGTHALTRDDVVFKDLGLLIVDEEQRFGTADKARIRELGTGIHVLTMTATPIPRTLQSALVGLQDLSVIATPPARRRPIRTLVAPFDMATIRIALMHEKANGGQSFVVVPRIEDLDDLAPDLAAHVPELTILTGHGQMQAHEVDAAMMAFAHRKADVLLATSIIESGLDVPRANTMIVCGAERFGLAQLHQLRGRVGRGSRQGTCYLMTRSDQPLPTATEQRLATLTTLDRLGSGMAISARDLDSRGAGDLLGEDQAGRLRVVGLGLYQHLLQLAIRSARDDDAENWSPEIHIATIGRLQPDYLPEPEVRLNLYARIARTMEASDVDAMSDEIQDRFGPIPEAVGELLTLARLKGLCRQLGIARVDGGPKAIAFTPRLGRAPDDLFAHIPLQARAGFEIRNGRVVFDCTKADIDDRLSLAVACLELFDTSPT